jgi:hypothetical protein
MFGAWHVRQDWQAMAFMCFATPFAHTWQCVALSQSHSGTGGTSRHRQDIGTTQRYLHLSPAALDAAAIRLLESTCRAVRAWQHCGYGHQRVIELLQMEQVSWGG